MKILTWLCRFFERIFCPQKENFTENDGAQGFDNWRGIASVDVGSKHLKAKPPIPCQDAARAQASAALRPCAFVADGAGSASLSHLGANETVLRLSHIVASLEDINVELLDKHPSPSQEEGFRYARRFIIHSSESIRNIADIYNLPFKKFHCTLLAAIVGIKWILWIKVGDGHIVREKNNEKLQIEGHLGKEEFANVTHFIKENVVSTNFDCGFFSTSETSGIALMTDGAAEKLVSNDGKKIAPRLSSFFKLLRNDEYRESNLHDFLSDKSIWKPPGYTGDDKGIALLSHNLHYR